MFGSKCLHDFKVLLFNVLLFCQCIRIFITDAGDFHIHFALNVLHFGVSRCKLTEGDFRLFQCNAGNNDFLYSCLCHNSFLLMVHTMINT